MDQSKERYLCHRQHHRCNGISELHTSHHRHYTTGWHLDLSSQVEQPQGAAIFIAILSGIILYIESSHKELKMSGLRSAAYVSNIPERLSLFSMR